MVSTLGAFGALFTATFILLTGNGLFNTLLSTRMAMEGFSTATAGLVLSCYFTGLLTGSFLCHRLIQRVGHIRAFTVFAATITAASLLHGLYLSAWFWGMLRFSSGITTFGIFMVIESWLNECTESHLRGRVFSVYMTLSYLGIGIGQQLLNAGDVRQQDLFIVAGIIFALCLIPVSATSGVNPRLPERIRFSFVAIFRKAPLGMMGSLAAGMTNSAFYTMVPVVCTDIGLPLHQLSWIMSITVFSGLAAQWAVGSLSDRFDRTIVLSVIASGISVFSALMLINGETSFGGMAVGMGLFGALMFAVYPVSVARTHDIFGGRDAVAVSGGLLFAYSVGASVSPVLASTVMTLMNTPFGLFAFWCLVNGMFAVTTLYLRKLEKVEIVPVEDQVNFVPMRSSSQVVMAMDPRSDPEIKSR
ncbi:MAG: MFS transporter [Desulfosarcina sp.]